MATFRTAEREPLTRGPLTNALGETVSPTRYVTGVIEQAAAGGFVLDQAGIIAAVKHAFGLETRDDVCAYVNGLHEQELDFYLPDAIGSAVASYIEPNLLATID